MRSLCEPLPTLRFRNFLTAEIAKSRKEFHPLKLLTVSTNTLVFSKGVCGNTP